MRHACCIPIMASVALLAQPGCRSAEPVAPLRPDAPASWQGSLEDRLRGDVRALADDFPGRSADRPERLAGAAEYLEERLSSAGFEVVSEWFEAPDARGRAVRQRNLIVEVPSAAAGGEDRWLVLGAHYDAVSHSPGADDNASGVAGVLALASYFREHPQAVNLRFELYANEEVLLGTPEHAGSLVRVRASATREERIVGAIVLEMIGYYTARRPSRDARAAAETLGVEVPSQGLFLAVAGWELARPLAERIVEAWEGPVPSLLLVGPDGDELLSRSDHWSYLQAGVPAVMVTDTAEFRNPNYHGRGDRPGTLDYPRMAHAVEALRRVVIDLAERPPAPVVVESRRLTIRNTRSEAVRVVVPSTELDRELAPGEALTIDVAGFAAIRLVGVATVRVGSQDISVEGDSDALVAITRGDGVPMGNVGRNRGSWLRTGPIGVGGVVIGE